MGNRRKNRDHLNKSSVKISENTEKSSGELRIFAVSQTLEKFHLGTLLKKKNPKKYNNEMIEKSTPQTNFSDSDEGL